MTLDPPAICIKQTGTARGRGAFSTRPFASGDVVETCPVVVFSANLRQVPWDVRRYLFDWGALAGVEKSQCIALGYGSMYNHENPANMRYEAIAQEQVIRFIAARDIGANEELTINYNGIDGSPVSSQDNWFPAMGVTPLDAPATSADA